MLSAASRWSTYLMAALFALIGTLLFLAPTWAAEHFLWKITPFVAMTMGAWYLGSAFCAFWAARIWRWSSIYPSLIFLWVFNILEMAILIAHSAVFRLDSALAWPYLIMISATTLISIKGIVDWAQTRPQVAADTPPMHPIYRVLAAGFVAYVILVACTAALFFTAEGQILPERLTPFTLRAFAAFYFALGMGAMPLIWGKSLEPLLNYMRAGLMLIALVTLAGLIYLDKFNFVERPGGLLYFGTYIVVGLGICVILLHNYSRRRMLRQASART